jgi:hypothetical protein
MRNREAMGHLAYMAMEVAVPQPGGGAKNCVRKNWCFQGHLLVFAEHSEMRGHDIPLRIIPQKFSIMTGISTSTYNFSPLTRMGVSALTCVAQFQSSPLASQSVFLVPLSLNY